MKPQVIFVFSVIVLKLISCSKNNEVELPQLRTIPIYEISATTAKSGGIFLNEVPGDIIKKGLVVGLSPNPTIERYFRNIYGGTEHGSFYCYISGLTPNTTYNFRAYATTRTGTSYGDQFSFETLPMPEVITDEITIAGDYHATGGGNVIDEGVSPVTERGVVYSFSKIPQISDFFVASGSGKGRFIALMSGLIPDSLYYVRAYAKNSYGTAYGNIVNFVIPGVKQKPKPVHCSENLVVVEIINPVTGKTWMDRNLWSTQVAEFEGNPFSYGDLYQWGRLPDYHQCHNSATRNTLSKGNNPHSSGFILTGSAPNDWRNPQNINLWQGVSGTNNPCPLGFRLPSATELDAERKSWHSRNAAGALASPLKLPAAGARSYKHGAIFDEGTTGYYWSSTVDGEYSHYLRISSDYAFIQTNFRAYGYSIRCIKD